MSNPYRFTVMMDDSSDYAEWIQCFEHFHDEESWDDVAYKIEAVQNLCQYVAKYGIDIKDMTQAFIDDLNQSMYDADEVGYFAMVEDMLNAVCVYTYNSDTWFEIYGKTVPITPKQVEELA
jgi:hypothetical protein